MHGKEISSISNGVAMSIQRLEADVIKAKTEEPVDNEERVEPKESTRDKKTSKTYITMFAAELLGTGLLMFLGCLGCIRQPENPPVVSGFAFGFTVMLIIQMFGHISGAHLNPAVTIATVLCGQLNFVMAVIYVIAQFIGATLGYGLLKILISEVEDGFCTTVLKSTVSVWQGLAIEIVITTVLIMVCYAIWDPRNSDKPDSVPLRFGIIIACISVGAGPYTGASMNTARSFAPVILGGSWDDQWIYWVGPNLAPFIAHVLYKLLFAEPAQKSPKEEEIDLDQVYVKQTQKS